MFVRLSLLFLLLLLCGGGGWYCGGCLQLNKSYALSGCLGDDVCTASQKDCVIQIQCKKVLKECQGQMVGRELNMRCKALDDSFFQIIAGGREGYLHVTVVKDNRVCQGRWTPRSE